MTGTYLAAAGSGVPAIRQAILAFDPTLNVVLDRPDLLVTVAPSTPVATFVDGAGVLVGTVFDHAWRSALSTIQPACSDAARQSDGRALVQTLWGGYVGFLIGRDNIPLVVRDPAGAMPCYHTSVGKVHVFTSDVALFDRATSFRPSVDWHYVSRHLYWPERRNRTTGLATVDELIPGERARVGVAGLDRDLLWNPWSFAGADQRVEDHRHAVDTVRRAVENSVAAWSHVYEQPLVSLSGGLDSSIVLTCLGPKAVAAVTFSTNEALGDERRYARDVAATFNTALLERRLEIGNIDPSRSHASGLPRPVARLFAQELDNVWRSALVETKADALFHGGGGDNVFCFLESAAPYVDSLLARGPGRDTARTLSDLSRMTNVSTWKLRLAAARKLLIDRCRYRWFRDPLFLTRNAIAAAEPVEPHPWFDVAPAKMLPGKQAHVAAIIRVQNYLEAVEPDRLKPAVAPLMSQPVLEACLRVPTWMWCAGGLNRAVARDAFRTALPPRIVERSSKGSPDAFDAQIVADHRPLIREMLLDGLLAAHGIIERMPVEHALSGSGPMRGTAYLRISELVNVEAWLQSWTGKRREPDA